MLGKPFFGYISGDALLLIALALGYIVCALAGKETKGLKTLGYVIGIVTISISALLIIGKVISAVSSGCGGRKHPMMNTPMMQKMMREQTPATTSTTNPSPKK